MPAVRAAGYISSLLRRCRWLVDPHFFGVTSLQKAAWLCKYPPGLSTQPQKWTPFDSSSLGVLQGYEFPGLLPKWPGRMSQTSF